ncbi:hypothetical protein GOBAR_AA07733 [Gossypium barbadense]|uniref:Uncharacterized protein n=1 Tax=Gossypium barbadense TaxID=3634 RepID=A0A2P5YBF8_GOSBA|nr:hypothetical protein GOBAR_AA07733 [Gossypium barbadense]
MFPKTYTKYLKYSAWASSLGNGVGKKDQFPGQTDTTMQLDVEGISTSRKLLAGSSEETPISSPLTPVLAIDSGKTKEKKVVANRTKVQAVLKKIKQSPKKFNLVAALIRGTRVEDALLQLQVTVKRAAKTVYQIIHSARANATHNHGLDPDRLLVAEAFIGKGMFLKRVSFHGKGYGRH